MEAWVLTVESHDMAQELQQDTLDIVRHTGVRRCLDEVMQLGDESRRRWDGDALGDGCGHGGEVLEEVEGGDLVWESHWHDCQREMGADAQEENEKEKEMMRKDGSECCCFVMTCQIQVRTGYRLHWLLSPGARLWPSFLGLLLFTSHSSLPERQTASRQSLTLGHSYLSHESPTSTPSTPSTPSPPRHV